MKKSSLNTHRAAFPRARANPSAADLPRHGDKPDKEKETAQNAIARERFHITAVDIDRGHAARVRSQISATRRSKYDLGHIAGTEAVHGLGESAHSPAPCTILLLGFVEICSHEQLNAIDGTRYGQRHYSNGQSDAHGSHQLKPTLLR